MNTWTHIDDLIYRWGLNNRALLVEFGEKPPMGHWARGALTASLLRGRGSSCRLVPLFLPMAPRAIRYSTTATKGRDGGNPEQKQDFDWEQSASSPTWLTTDPQDVEEGTHASRVDMEGSPSRKLRTPDTVSIYPRYPHEHVLSIQEVVDYVFAKVYLLARGPAVGLYCTDLF